MAKKLSIEEVNDVVESEGLSVAILEYVAPTQIADPSLAKYWHKARLYLDIIQGILDGDDVDEDEDD